MKAGAWVPAQRNPVAAHRGSGLCLALLLGAAAALQLAAGPGMRARAAEPAPAVARQGVIDFVSGGIGEDEMQWMRAQAADYNLRLTFAIKRSGQYLSGIEVRIEDAAGGQLFAATSDGPLLLANLPPGRYRVVATDRGARQIQQAVVRPKAAANLYFYWDGRPEDNDGDGESADAPAAQPRPAAGSPG